MEMDITKNLAQNTRISVSYSNKVNGRSLMVTITKDIPEGITELAHVDSMENELRTYVDSKVNSYKSVQEFDSFKENPNVPPCPVCGKSMKPSKKGTRWLCVDSRWRMVNGRFENSGCSGNLDRNQR